MRLRRCPIREWLIYCFCLFSVLINLCLNWHFGFGNWSFFFLLLIVRDSNRSRVSWRLAILANQTPVCVYRELCWHPHPSKQTSLKWLPWQRTGQVIIAHGPSVWRMLYRVGCSMVACDAQINIQKNKNKTKICRNGIVDCVNGGWMAQR